MKKSSTSNKAKPYSTDEPKVPQVSEPFVTMQSFNRLPVAVANFPYKKFKTIADKAPFTQAEWAAILHLSERTLQRYAKDNKNFEGIYVDRILQIDKLIDMALETFADADSLYRWLHRSKNILGNELSFESLYTTPGINALYEEMGRIQHGVYI